MQDIVIRKIKKLDINDVIKIGTAELKSSANEIKEGIKTAANYQTSKTFVALKDEKIIGFATIWWEAKACKIGYIAIKKNEQNKGIGTAIIKHIENFCRKRKLKMLHTSTQPDNEKAINFYRYNKFKKTGYRKDVFEKGVNEIYFTKYL